MTPTHQTAFGDGVGNCVAACYATLLDIPLSAVPPFERAEHQWLAEEQWLAERGLALVGVRAGTGPVPPGVLHMASGVSPRGIPHRVVCRGGDVIHDPYPDGGGLVRVDRWVYLVPIDPAERGRIARALGAYPDSDLISLAESVAARAAAFGEEPAP